MFLTRLFLITAGKDADHFDGGFRLSLTDGGKEEAETFDDIPVAVQAQLFVPIIKTTFPAL